MESLMGRKCRLIELEEQHIPHVVSLLNKPQVSKYLRLRTPVSVTRQTERLLEGKASGRELTFAVLATGNVDDLAEGSLIGIAGLVNIDAVDKTAQGRMIIGETSCWGRGIGTEARLIQLKHAFDVLDLRWVWGSAYSPNIGSKRILEKTGYRQIGIRPESRKIGEVYYDEVLYGVRREWWEPFWFAYSESPLNL